MFLTIFVTLNIKFQNDVCNTETAMNGTCYTAEECSNRDGVATGSCADGFGVCCVSKFEEQGVY